MKELTLITMGKKDLKDVIREILEERRLNASKEPDNRLNPQEDEIFNTTQAAKFLKISRMTLHRRMAEGSVPHRRLGRRIMFPKLELLSWLRGQGEFKYNKEGGHYD